MTQFQICTIDRGPHAACFTEVAWLLRETLQTLGFSCDLGNFQAPGDHCRIILGYHLLGANDGPLQRPYVVYQLETLTTDLVETNRSLFANALGIWDYSVDNVRLLARTGIVANYLPIGFHPALDVISPCEEKHDVLFYGSLTPRRVAILEGLRQRGLNVRAMFGVYGKERDEAIAASRIVLNIRQVAGNRFESVRVAWLLNNRRFVISEAASDACAGVVCVPYDQLESACVYFLTRPDLREQLANQGGEEFRCERPMTDLLRERLANLACFQ